MGVGVLTMDFPLYELHVYYETVFIWWVNGSATNSVYHTFLF